jgi:hypothetical protein
MSLPWGGGPCFLSSCFNCLVYSHSPSTASRRLFLPMAPPYVPISLYLLFLISAPPVVVAFGHSLPWGGGPCFPCFCFFMSTSTPTAPNCIAPAFFLVACPPPRICPFLLPCIAHLRPPVVVAFCWPRPPFCGVSPRVLAPFIWSMAQLAIFFSLTSCILVQIVMRVCCGSREIQPERPSERGP